MEIILGNKSFGYKYDFMRRKSQSIIKIKVKPEGISKKNIFLVMKENIFWKSQSK